MPGRGTRAKFRERGRAILRGKFRRRSRRAIVIPESADSWDLRSCKIANFNWFAKLFSRVGTWYVLCIIYCT